MGSAAFLEKRRRQAVQAVHGGDSVKDVARILGVNRCSIYRWLRMAERSPGLAAVPHPGPPRKLSRDQEIDLERLLRQGAQAHGWPNQLWTTARIAQVIARHFGVTLHHDHIGRFLRQRLRWSAQKPRRRARERDEAAIRHWKRHTFPAIARQTRQRGAHLVFLDESGFMLTPTVRRTWAPQGQTPILSTWDRRDRLSAVSAITVSPRRGRLNFSFALHEKNIQADDIVAFMRQLKAQLRGPFTVIWDGSTIHSKAGQVQAYLARHPEIQTATLPGYAPELNPDEGAWGWSKYGHLANLAAHNIDELQDHIIDGFFTLKENPHLLKGFIEHTDLALAA